MRIGKRMITIKYRKWILIGLFCAIVLIGIVLYYSFGLKQRNAKVTVTIAVLQNDKVQDYNTNYYTRWLEERTGYQIEFEYILDGYEKEFLNVMLTSNSKSVDAVFLPKDKEILTVDELAAYYKDGLIHDLSEYVTKKSNLSSILQQYNVYGLREKMSKDGKLFYVPYMDTARKSQNMQVLWMNADWLKELGLKVPQTTDDLKKVLEAFRDGDPNKNGIKDELPLISCEASYSLQSYNYLMNAFIYNDPMHARMYINKGGNLLYAAKDEAYRNGLIYCNNLYEENLLAHPCFSYTTRQIKELVSDPEDLVGCFTSKSISEVIYPYAYDVLARFIQVPPLLGPEGEQNAVWVNYEPRVGGYIPSTSRHPEEAFQIMDFMLSDEASLIAEYGEEGVDWKYSDSGDLSTYGSKAKITTIHYLNDGMQNKNYAGSGPQVLDASYANGVTWNGNNYLVEYIDARAVRTYEPYFNANKDILGKLTIDDNERFREISLFSDKRIVEFITGELDCKDNQSWRSYINKFEAVELKISTNG